MPDDKKTETKDGSMSKLKELNKIIKTLEEKTDILVKTMKELREKVETTKRINTKNLKKVKELELNRNIDKKIKYFKDDEQQVHYKINQLKLQKKLVLENINTAV